MKAVSRIHGPCPTLRLDVVVLVAVAGLALAAGASAQTSYTLTYGYPSTDHTSSSPMRFDGVFSDANGSYAEQAFAIPDHVSADSHSQSTYGSVEVRALANADDFTITGGGSGYVSATVHFMLHLALAHSGPIISNSISAQGWFNFYTYDYDTGTPTAVTGTAFSGNSSSYGSGFLASYAGGNVDTPVDLAASLPVGHPFRIVLSVSAASGAYAGACDTEGLFAGDLGDASGVVMDLPSGYTVNSADWGVVNNQVAGTTAVADAAPTPLAWGRPSPNPSRGPLALAYTLPRAGAVSVDILDVQGRVVRTFAGGLLEAGTHRFTWDGLDTGGHRATVGVYFARLRFEGRTTVCRLARVE